MILFVGYPCVERISLVCGAKRREVTWEGVGRVCRRVEVVVFQMWIVASFVPPPEARREGCQGHQAMAYRVVIVS
jgi:hypothetical protein